MKDDAAPKTAFVLAGGGSFGAVQAGMLRAAGTRGLTPDFIVGSSLGAINGAYLAEGGTGEHRIPVRYGLMRTEAAVVEYPRFQAVWVMSARQRRR